MGTGLCHLFSAQTSNSQYQKGNTAASTQKPGFHAMANQNTQTESHHYTAEQMIPSAHNNTPCTAYAGGVYNLTAGIPLTFSI